MLKKINNKHLFILIVIMFTLNILLFESIDKTFAQFTLPTSKPSEGTGSNIIVNPLQEDLNLGGYSVIGDGTIDIDGNINSFGTICDTNSCLGDSLFEGDLVTSGYLNVGGQNVITSNDSDIIMGDLMSDDGSRGLILRSGDTDSIFIDQTGNVGIGMSPGYKLDLNGSLRIANGNNVISRGSAHYTMVQEDRKSVV